jgi:hypothetical protein
MDTIKNILLFLTAAVFIVSTPLSAGAATNPETPWGFRCAVKNLPGLQCGIDYVQPGETQEEVLQQCGPPDAGFSNPDYGRHGEANPNLERWTYNRGPEDFVYDFMFRNGQLEDIERIGRGF